MSMRISSVSFAVALTLAACAPESGAPQGASVECAFEASASYAADCLVESAGGGVFTIHHPDSSFQRVRYDRATGAVSAADGADDVSVISEQAADVLEFSVASARYRVEREALANPAP